MIKELILKNRSYRRFYEDRIIEIDTLRELVDLARLSPSGANRQGLKYVISNTKEKNNKIYDCLGWAGYLKDWGGPEEGERPSAYLVVVSDTSLGAVLPQDEGIAGQSILLGAVEKGLGGCFIKNINKKKLADALNLDDKYEISLVLALGYPKEEVVIEPINENGDIKYWRDENAVHHVPKRGLDELIL